MARRRSRNGFVDPTKLKQQVVVGNLSSLKRKENLSRFSELIERQPKLTTLQLAERLGMKVATVRRYKKLLGIPSEFQTKLVKIKWLEYFFPGIKPIELAEKIGCTLPTIYALKKKIGSKVKEYKSRK